MTASGVTGTIDHNQNNELRLYGDISFDYDANGNLTQKTSLAETRHYVYNVQNRLVRVEDSNHLTVAEYGYDPFGRRLWKEVDGVRTYFLYSDEGLIAEYDENGIEIRSYGYRPNSTWGTDPLWLKENSEYYWYQNDHLGTPQKLVDSSGTVVWLATYTAFGEATIDIETVTNNLRFPGQYFDAETGLHYNFHRYYDPEVGRYTQVDPIGLDGGDINLYAYVGSNTPNEFDPSGLVVGADDVIGGVAACLASPQCRRIMAAGAAVASVALGKAAAYIYDTLPPFAPLGVPPVDIPGYPALQPHSPFFPPIPGISDYCDPMLMGAREHGETYLTRKVLEQARRTGGNPCDMLKAMEVAEKSKGRNRNKKLLQEIKTAQKFLGCRQHRGN